MVSLYSQFEIIFWYSSFVIVVFLFIIYLKNSSNKKKNIEIISNKLLLEKNQYASLLEDLKNNNKINKNTFKKTLIVLSTVESSIIEYRDLTNLQDFNKILDDIKELSKLIRKQKNKYSIESVTEIITIFNTIYNELDNVKPLVK